MRNHTLRISSLFVVTAILLSACGKDPVVAKTKTELITASSWKFDKATASGIDISSHPALACYIDNVMTFASNLSGTISEGAVVCSTAAPATFTWSFQSNETILRYSFTLIQGGSSDFTIVSLTETNLVLSQMITFPGAPAPANVEVTFKH